MPQLLELLVVELERMRPLPAQVTRHLTDTFDVGRDEVGAFLETRLGKLEEDELDLLWSPLFTPKLVDQAPFAALLGTRGVPREEWPDLIQQLESRPTQARVRTEDGKERRFPLRAVTLERYVHRLRLDATLPEPVFDLIQSRVPAADRPLFLAVARRAVWDTPARREIFARLLVAADPHGPHFRPDTLALLQLMETSLPTDVDDVRRRLPSWVDVVRTLLADAGRPKPFFNNRVEDLHGGGRDQRGGDATGAAQRQAELEFLGRLNAALS